MSKKKRAAYFVYKYILLGRSLETSLNNIIDKVYLKRIPEADELANFFGAIIRRFTKLWGVTLLITIMPTIITILILINQNILLSRQTEFFKFQFKNE